VLLASKTVYDVYLGINTFLVCAGTTLLSFQATSSEWEAIKVLNTWLTEILGTSTGKTYRVSIKRIKLRIWLSGGLSRPWIMPSISGLRGEEEWRRSALAMVTSKTGFLQACEVWIEPRVQGDSRIAVAVPADFLLQIERVVGQFARTVKLLCVAPWWSEALRLVEKDSNCRVLAVQDYDALTILAGANNTITNASIVTPLFEEAAAQAALTRSLLALDMKSEELG